MTTTWVEDKREREPVVIENCIACSHPDHAGVCGSTARIFATGPCRCGEKV